MRNILGPSAVSLQQSKAPLPRVTERIRLHWYGKQELRPSRKLGHMNGTVDSVDDLDELLGEMISCEARWIDELTKEGK